MAFEGSITNFVKPEIAPQVIERPETEAQRVIREARETIENRGWSHHGSGKVPGGPVCIEQALGTWEGKNHHATPFVRRAVQDHLREATQPVFFGLLKKKRYEKWQTLSRHDRLYIFNDCQAKSVADIVAVLNRAYEIAES